jgi:phospholipid/cholesterol/gamma-HCH transport system ATP-binding protein
MQDAAPQFAIRVHDLVVGFGRHVVIDHLSLDVRKGEILGLVGASGGGKSVLMRSGIPGLDRCPRDRAGRRGDAFQFR